MVFTIWNGIGNQNSNPVFAFGFSLSANVLVKGENSSFPLTSQAFGK